MAIENIESDKVNSQNHDTPSHFIPLRIKFLFYILPIISLVLITTLGIIGWSSYGKQLELLHKRADFTTRLQVTALSSPISEKRITEIDLIIHNLENDPDFLGAGIIDLQVEINPTKNNELPSRVQFIHGSLEDTQNSVVSQRKIFSHDRNQSKYLGTLILILSKKTINEFLNEFILTIIISFIILVISITSALFLILQNVIIKPIHRILASIADIQQKQWTFVEWSNTDELGFLIRSFNYMIADLESGDKAQIKLQESEERYALSMRGANDGLWDWNLVSNTLHLSPRWNSMLGLEELASVKSDKEWLDRIHPEDRENVIREIKYHINKKTAALVVEHRMLHRDGSYRWMLVRGLGIADHNKVIHRMAGSLTDVTERKKNEEILQFNMHYDMLTSLPNRTLLINCLSNALSIQLHDHNYKMALLFIDFDRFKNVNDTLGHKAGDQMIVICSQRLKECVRSSDTVARFSGDEFVILIEDIKKQSDAIDIIHKIQENFSSVPIQVDNQRFFTTASIGVIFGDSRYHDTEDMLRDCDIALFEAKSTGRDRYVVFEHAMQNHHFNILEIDSELRVALQNDDVKAYYQPLINKHTGALKGFEALSRWLHPERGLISPNHFIPIAEETGLIRALGEHITRKVINEISKHKKEIDAQNLIFSINCSAKELLNPRYARNLGDLLSKHNIHSGQIKIEITESTLISDTKKMVRKLEEIKELGVQLWIDDFGTGYSSLGQLDTFPFHGIKIDQSFVSVRGKNPEDLTFINKPSIIRTIVALAQTMGVETVAEGIETAQQHIQLRMLGVDIGQGYLYAKPLPTNEMVSLVKKNQRWDFPASY